LQPEVRAPTLALFTLRGNTMSSQTQAKWTDDRVDTLTSLWEEGLSASQIARVLGGVTRNAVIGKVHRIGLAGRESPSHFTQTRPRLPPAPRITLRQHIPSPPIVEEDSPVLKTGKGKYATILTIEDGMCRWPIGEPSEEEFHFCGRKQKEGFPYCEAHARKAYQPHQERRDKM
jgi:GcrA cell cycle regulator